MRRPLNWLLAVLAATVLAGCGGNSATNGTPASGGAGGPSTSPLPVQHVVVVVEENHSYESVIGSSSMPYLNGLAAHYGLATSYYANTHPSIGNYFMMTTGAIVTNDDAYTGTVSSDNIVRVLASAGKTWKVYAESLPSVGYVGGDQYPYAKRHNPFAYFSDVINDPAAARNIVPFSQFAADLSAGTLPNFAFIVPNTLDDGHDGPLLVADTWLRVNFDPLLANTAFLQSGLALIVFDESVDTDTAHGGGHVAAVLVGNKVKPGYQSTTLFQHESALRFALQALGVSQFPGASAGASSFAEFLQ
jgi:phospholipase C